jgi:NADPH:quinone reductase
VDTKIRSGMLAAIAPDPHVPGCDVAGTVEALGEGVSGFRPGDAVYGCAGGVKGCHGALAEYMTADAALLAPMPAGLSFEEAAALPLVCITAWDGLMDRANVQAGQRVLVHGGAGGVGHVAVQLCAARGAEVWATVSTPEKAAIARSMGAAGTIDYRAQSVADYVQQVTAGRGFDVVFDSVGGENVARCFEAAAVSGTVVSISTRTSADLSPLHAKGLSLHVVFMLIPMLYGSGRARHGQILREISALVEAGKLRPLIDAQRFTFATAAAAHAHLASGQATGKIVLTGF